MSTDSSQGFFERVTKNPVNVVAQLLSQGQKAYYAINGTNVVKYPDGRMFRVEVINGKIVEKEAYEERRSS